MVVGILLLYLMMPVIIPFVFAFVLAYLFNPLVKRLSKYIKRWVAIIIVYSTITLGMVLLLVVDTDLVASVASGVGVPA